MRQTHLSPVTGSVFALSSKLRFHLASSAVAELDLLAVEVLIVDPSFAAMLAAPPLTLLLPAPVSVGCCS